MKAEPLDPGSTLGVVGGGQLGRMLALEARRMGYRTVVLDPGEHGPAAQVADRHIRAPLNDAEALRTLAAEADVLTIEWENAEPELLRAVGNTVPVRPGPHLLEIARDRLREKERVRELGIGTADYRAVRNAAGLRNAVAELGTPAILKTTHGGYDGRGQARIDRQAEADAAFETLGAGRQALILEAFVPFEAELSVVCARSSSGETATFPVARNVHVKGILDTTEVPASVPATVADRARRIALTLAEGLRLEGVMAVELFLTPDDELLVNEIAPRPHNSGHYTWEACPVSQFEQQLRAICNLPLGATDLLRPAAMANLLGRHTGDPVTGGWPEVPVPMPLPALHLYGKDAVRPDRKMGHLTALADTPGLALHTVTRARQSLLRRHGEGQRCASGKTV